MPASSDTLFESLEHALGTLPADRRVLAGLRDGHEWVELSRDELHDATSCRSAPSSPRWGFARVT